MRVDPDTCRDPDLLAAEVRRLRAVIASAPLALTDAEREAIKVAVSDYEDNDMDAGCWQIARTLRGLLERLAR
jgi:hypothetical protein